MAMLSLGARGDDVRKLQTALNRAGSNIAVDGHFGDKTRRAVCNFQEDHGLKIDGIVGTATRKALEPYYGDFTVVKEAFERCLKAIEQLPEFQQLEKMLNG